MLRWTGLLILVILTAGCAMSETGKVSPPSTPTATPPLKSRVIFVGHRGAAGEAPENTLAAFQRALDVGVDAIELDVHLSKDDELVVMHDPRIERTTDGSGTIRELTLAELERFNAAAKYSGMRDYAAQRIPTLQQVFDLVGTRVEMLIEIKLDVTGNRYPGIEQKVVELVRRNKAERTTTVGSFDLATLQEIQQLEPQLKRTAFVSTTYLGKMGMKSKGPVDIAADLAASGAQAVGMDRSYPSEALVLAFKQAGLAVGVWTVDDFVEMWKWIDMGVDTITTNRPSLLMDKYRQGRNPK